MKAHAFFLVFLLLLICGITRLFALEAHWSSDENLWLRRSAQFMSAVQEGEFEKTLIAPHPGVITMWLGGFRPVYDEHTTRASLKDLAFVRWFIGITAVAGLGIAIFLCHRIFGTSLTLAITAFLAFDPFLLAQTRRVHTDALAATFLLIAILMFLSFCRKSTVHETHPKHRYLVFGGIAFGLACLSKIYAIALLPWLPICLWIFRGKNTSWRQFIYGALPPISFFTSYGVLTLFVLWPIFWNPIGICFGIALLSVTLWLKQARKVEKRVKLSIGIAISVLIASTVYAVATFAFVFEKVGRAITTAHEVEHFFLGQIVADPGLLFYPFALSIKSTPFVLPLAIGTVLLLWRYRKHNQFEQHAKIAFALAAVILIFTVSLSFTSKKFSRYLLVAFPLLDLLAGIGIFYTIKWIGARFKNLNFRKLTHVSAGIIVILLTAAPVLARHPYYGTYYNIFWKITDITQMFTVGDASGLDLAANYLNQKKNAPHLKVQVSTLSAEFFYPYFVGHTYQLAPKFMKNLPPLPPVDYEVVYIRDSQVNWAPQDGTQGGELEHIISLNGIDYVWIYKVNHGTLKHATSGP